MKRFCTESQNKQFSKGQPKGEYFRLSVSPDRRKYKYPSVSFVPPWRVIQGFHEILHYALILNAPGRTLKWNSFAAHATSPSACITNGLSSTTETRSPVR
jgi:hypothetical protein